MALSEPMKEATVLLLDVGRSMTSGGTDALNSARQALSMLVQQKLLFSPKDEVGLILFGTRETKNDLDGYEHISVVRAMEPPNLDFIKLIDDIRPGQHSADLVDAIIVGLDMLIKRTGKYRFRRRMFVITDAGAHINTDDLDVVKQQFEQHEAKLNLIGVNFDDDDAHKSAVKKLNEATLQKFVESVDGQLVTVHDAIAMIAQMRKKATLPRTTFRGMLEISPQCRIGVWAYLKTSKQSFPTLKKLSTYSQQSKADHKTLSVVRDSNMMPVDDPDKLVDKDDRIKGYKYGRSIVPFPDGGDDDQLSYKVPERELKIMGFINRSLAPHHMFMSTVEQMFAVPQDKPGGEALSALIHSLIATDTFALIRVVKRARTEPQYGVLMPKVSASGGYECLMYCRLPTAEDWRSFAFRSLVPPLSKPALTPTAEQVEAAGALIDSLQLCKGYGSSSTSSSSSSTPSSLSSAAAAAAATPSSSSSSSSSSALAATAHDGEKSEMLKPSECFNPVLHRFYQSVQLRAVAPHLPLPKLDADVAAQTSPNPDLFGAAKPQLDRFCSLFPLEQNPKSDKGGQRRFWKDVLAGDDVSLDSYVPDPKRNKKTDAADLSMDAILGSRITKVGTSRPVKDFDAMLGRRDVDLVVQACEQMAEVIVRLVVDSVRDQLYPKALTCLQALRGGAVREDEAALFNKFLNSLRDKFKDKERHDFYELMRASKILPISDDECDESTLSAEEAAAWYGAVPKPAAAPAHAPPPSSGDDEVDALLAGEMT